MPLVADLLNGLGTNTDHAVFVPSQSVSVKEGSCAHPPGHAGAAIIMPSEDHDPGLGALWPVRDLNRG